VTYARSLANFRSQEGFEASEVCQALMTTGDYISSALLALPETKGMELLIHDWVILAVELAVDEIEEAYERIDRTKRAEMGEKLPEVCE